MKSFVHDGFSLAYLDEGEGQPVLLLHGFASSARINWVGPGWTATLRQAGYRVIALDNRGHGASSASYDPADYRPEKMASDAAALLDHLGIDRAHVFGYSMGARIAAFMALAYPDKVMSLVFGGLGIGMVEGVGEWESVAEALLAPDPATIAQPQARSFRDFADQTGSDRKALAACIESSRALLGRSDMARIMQPTLVAVGTRDDIGPDPQSLARLMPNAEAFDIEGRNHMLAVGDQSFKKKVVAFLAANPG